METISVAINGSSDKLCFDQYLINIFAKTTEAKRLFPSGKRYEMQI